MRIPIYRSQVQRTNEAPGRSFSARMDARPFVEAALQKGAATRALADAVGAYAEQRGKMIAEAEYNETALALDEEIRTATYDLSRSNDIGNIFDGNKLWEKRMKSIQSNVLGRVKNSNVRRKLDFSFNQSEIQSRFRLQGVVDDKIIKRDQAAIAARQTNAVAALSQIGATTTDYAAFFGTGTTPGKNGVMTAPGVAGGRANAGAVSKANLAMRVDVASGYVANRYGADINSNRRLRKFVSLQDEIQTGQMTIEKAMSEAGMVDAYAATVLSQIPRAEALKIVQGNMKLAQAAWRADEEVSKDIRDGEKRNLTAAYKMLYTGRKTLTQNDLKSIGLPDNYLRPLLPLFKEGNGGLFVVDSAVAKKKIYEWLDVQNFLSRDQRAALDEELASGTADTLFPKESRARIKVQMNLLANQGELTEEILSAEKPNLSSDDYITLQNMIFSEADANFRGYMKTVSAVFNWTEETAGSDDDLAQAANAAYFSVYNDLSDWFREPENKDATIREIKAEGERLVSAVRAEFDAAKEQKYLNFLAKIEKYGGSGLKLKATNPIKSIDDFIAARPSMDRNTKDGLLRRKQALLKSYGAFFNVQ
jgi:hypothetical protein